MRAATTTTATLLLLATMETSSAATPVFSKLRQDETACAHRNVGVSLFDCPVTTWRTIDNPTSDEDPLQFSFVTYDWEIPFINPSTAEPLNDGGYFTMRTKTYTIPGATASIPAPTLVWEKGAVVHMNLTNDLHLNPDPNNSTLLVEEENWHNNYYDTNIHTHGLHISSYEDDPSVQIFPAQHKLYEFNLPANHAGGLHWYHPHTHPMSELHLGAGVFGLMRIEESTDGTELPVEITELEVMDLSIAKIYPGKLLDISDGFVGPFDFINQEFPRAAIDEQTFGLDYDATRESEVKLLDSSTFYTLVNGYVMPKLEMVSGRWYRVGMLYVGDEGGDQLPSEGKFHFGENTFQSADSAATCITKLIAKDGVHLRTSRDLDFEGGNRIWLHPASRSEVMIKCTLDEGVETDSTMALIMDTSEANTVTVRQSIPIMSIEVTAETDSTVESIAPTDEFQITACLPSYLPDMRGAEIPIAQMASFVEKFKDDVDIQGSVRDSTKNTYYHEDTATFDIEIAPFWLNGDYFRGYERPEAALNVSVWELNNVYQLKLIHGTHPVHIHVNHMQLQENVSDVTGYHVAGDYVDTLASACPVEGCSAGSDRDAVESVTVRMFMERFPGRVLIHCHIMDHADSGAIGEAFILPNDEEYVEHSWNTDCGAQMQIVTN